MAVSIVEDGDNQFLVKFVDVYLSYPHLHEPYRGKGAKAGEQQGKYGAKFCFDRNNPENRKDAITIHAKIQEMAKKSFKQGLPADRYCLRDGKQLGDDMHKFYVLSASETTKPLCVDRRRNIVTAEDELFYPGCKVNGTIRLWVQDSKDWGKRINANLVGVQFYAHSESWGRPKPKAEDVFDDISDQFDSDEYEESATASSGGDGFDSDFDI